MAKAKYKKGSDGYFCTRVWDGTYNSDGTKHRVTLRSKKSSADLEKQVTELKIKIKEGNIVHNSDITFYDYVESWLNTYKAVRSTNGYTGALKSPVRCFGNHLSEKRKSLFWTDN